MLPKKIIFAITLSLVVILTTGEFYNRHQVGRGANNLPHFSLGASLGTIKFTSTTKTDRPAPIFPTVKLTGKTAIVYDIENKKIIFAKDENKVMPLASITKLMTALIASEKLAANTSISINAAAVTLGGGTRLKVGEQYSLKDLTALTLVGSLNEGAAAIAAGTEQLLVNTNFIDLMNEKAASLGMTNTHFLNETGLDLNGAYGGSYGSALDIAKLFSYIVKTRPELVEATRHSFVIVPNGHKQTIGVANTNEAINRLPGIIASKTGYTDLADGNLAVVIDGGVRRPIVIVVLGSSKAGRFSDVETLTRATYAYLKTE